MFFIILAILAIFLTMYFGSMFLAEMENFHDEERKRNGK